MWIVVDANESRCGLARDLLAIPGIGPDTAARIVDTLRDQGQAGRTTR